MALMPIWPRRQAPFIAAICLLLAITRLIVGALRIGHPRGVPAFYFIGAVSLVAFTATGLFGAYREELPGWWSEDPTLLRSAGYAAAAALLGLTIGGLWIAGGIQKSRPSSIALGAVVAASGLVWLLVWWRRHRTKTQAGSRLSDDRGSRDG